LYNLLLVTYDPAFMMKGVYFSWYSSFKNLIGPVS
jgi:hypothetical protein